MMPGLVPAAGTQAVSRSRRQSRAGANVPRGWCWDLEAGAEDMAVGCPTAAETLSPCTSPARTYIREPGVTSASCAHAGATAARRPPKAQPCPTRDSAGKPVPPFFPTRAHRGSGGKQGPTLLLAPNPGGVRGPGALTRAPHGGYVASMQDMQGPSWARVPRGFGGAQPRAMEEQGDVASWSRGRGAASG